MWTCNTLELHCFHAQFTEELHLCCSPVRLTNYRPISSQVECGELFRFPAITVYPGQRTSQIAKCRAIAIADSTSNLSVCPFFIPDIDTTNADT